jgi:ATP-dependent DNA helicase PIF1
MSAQNQMDPGVLPAYLPALTQIEEMIIARSHIQMIIYRYRGHQYHYSGHCVSFLLNAAKMIDTLPNLPGELNVVILRPSDYLESDLRYRHQFRSDFRVRKNHIITWLNFLKVHHPDYQHVNISNDRIDLLPLDGDISSSFVTVTAGIDDLSEQQLPISDELPPPNSQSMVPNLNITTTEADLIMQQLVDSNIAPGLPAPSIRQTPIDEASGKDRIFAMAFPTLYPTGQADFNTSRVRKVALNDYIRHLLCYKDGRFGRHPRWRFFAFNILM